MEKLTEETLLVSQLNPVKLIEMLKREVKTKLLPNQEYRINADAIVMDGNDMMIVNKDCCYHILEKTCLPGGHPGFYYRMPVYLNTKKDDGFTTIGIYPEFYFLISIGILKTYTVIGKPVPLRQFMGGRYNYNPRIRKNMKEFLHLINQINASKLEEIY